MLDNASAALSVGGYRDWQRTISDFAGACNGNQNTAGSAYSSKD